MANGDYAWTNGDWAYNNALEAGKDKQMISEGKGRGNRLLPSTWEEDLYTGSPFRLWRSFGLSFSWQIDTVTSGGATTRASQSGRPRSSRRRSEHICSIFVNSRSDT